MNGCSSEWLYTNSGVSLLDCFNDSAKSNGNICSELKKIKNTVYYGKYLLMLILKPGT